MASRNKKKREASGLNINSMMDMFTIVLVFLLKSFSAEGNLMSSATNLILPVSSQSKTPTEVSLSLVADDKWILVDDQQLASVEDVRKQDSLNVQPVYEILVEKRKVESDAELAGLTDIAAGKIVLQFDKTTEYDIVTKMVATCGYAGYNNVKFAVNKREGEE